MMVLKVSFKCECQVIYSLVDWLLKLIIVDSSGAIHNNQ